MEKEWEQNFEWLEAQKIEISVDLFVAAKQQLHFLKVVDQNPWLYNGPMLERAIYRYNAYWLPLLAKYDESSPISEGPLVPPFDCEWVWHCHRLNPVRYKLDCEQLYGRVLDNYGVVSSTNRSCKLQTENLWKRLYPMEPYDLDVDKAISKPNDISALEKCTTYDLASAVKRQSSFYNNISRAHVNNDIIVQEAVCRYKAFIYLTKINHEKSINLMSVPTFDIDLIWHTHQLNPSSYYKDMETIFGNILHHDDTESDKGNGKKLGNFFSTTSALWEETFGQRYWKSNVETPTVVIATKKHCVGLGAAEKHGACVMCRVEVAEKHGAGAKCRAEVAAKHSVGAKYRAEVVENQSVDAISHCFVKCVLMVAKKQDAGSECFVETVEKTGQLLSVVRAKVAEKHDVASECIAACVSIVAKKEDAGIECFAVEKNSARVRCCCKVDEKNDASSKFFVEAVEKHGAGARCCCKVAEKNNTIYCRVAVAEKNGRCGNVMKSANENAPLVKALNGVVSA